MKFGVCYDSKKAISAVPEKADYLEIDAVNFLRFEPEVKEQIKKTVSEGRIKTYSCCHLIESKLCLTGADADHRALKDYCDKLFYLLAELNIKLLVFGSGKARSVPDGFSEEKAWEQLFEVGYILADKAKSYGQIIAVEPLSYNETNVVNTVDEAVYYVKNVNRENFKAMVDYYHFDNNGEVLSSLEKNREFIAHAHFATAKTRTMPRSEEDWRSFAEFIRTLKQIGYDGHVSFEGGSFESWELDPMIQMMKEVEKGLAL